MLEIFLFFYLIYRIYYYPKFFPIMFCSCVNRPEESLWNNCMGSNKINKNIPDLKVNRHLIIKKIKKWRWANLKNQGLTLFAKVSMVKRKANFLRNRHKYEPKSFSFRFGLNFFETFSKSAFSSKNWVLRSHDLIYRKISEANPFFWNKLKNSHLMFCKFYILFSNSNFSIYINPGIR